MSTQETTTEETDQPTIVVNTDNISKELLRYSKYYKDTPNGKKIYCVRSKQLSAPTTTDEQISLKKIKCNKKLRKSKVGNRTRPTIRFTKKKKSQIRDDEQNEDEENEDGENEDGENEDGENEDEQNKVVKVIRQRLPLPLRRSKSNQPPALPPALPPPALPPSPPALPPALPPKQPKTNQTVRNPITTEDTFKPINLVMVTITSTGFDILKPLHTSTVNKNLKQLIQATCGNVTLQWWFDTAKLPMNNYLQYIKNLVPNLLSPKLNIKGDIINVTDLKITSKEAIQTEIDKNQLVLTGTQNINDVCPNPVIIYNYIDDVDKKEQIIDLKHSELICTNKSDTSVLFYANKKMYFLINTYGVLIKKKQNFTGNTVSEEDDSSLQSDDYLNAKYFMHEIISLIDKCTNSIKETPTVKKSYELLKEAPERKFTDAIPKITTNRKTGKQQQLKFNDLVQTSEGGTRKTKKHKKTKRKRKSNKRKTRKRH